MFERYLWLRGSIEKDDTNALLPESVETVENLIFHRQSYTLFF